MFRAPLNYIHFLLGVKQVRIRSPTPRGLPPSLNDIVGEASPERVKANIYKDSSSPIPFPTIERTVHDTKTPSSELPECKEDRHFEPETGSGIGTSSALGSYGEDDMASFIVGESDSEDDSVSPILCGALQASQSGAASLALPRDNHSVSSTTVFSQGKAADADSDEDIIGVNFIVGEAMGDVDPPQPWRSVRGSNGLSNSDWDADGHISSPDYTTLIIDEADDSDSLWGGWDSQCDDEGTHAASSSTNGTSPLHAMPG
uniref:HMG box domain-containing protein n=1 Tax=Ganoderma boninense TaxID=34458 RepID=A0A5K1K792_9APHY|nr:HMG box domain-containing protein [Ganoderma boninense]